MKNLNKTISEIKREEGRNVNLLVIPEAIMAYA